MSDHHRGETNLSSGGTAHVQPARHRDAGLATIAGASTMLIGAALWGTTGTDLWAALDADDLAGYLVAIAPHRGQLIANLSFWIVGVLILGVAGNLLGGLSRSRPTLSRIGSVCVAVAVPLGIVSYFAMLVLVVQIAPDTSPTSVQIARAFGWFGARADDLATALILGAGALCFSLAGRGEWAPRWLVGLGWLCALFAVLSLVAPFFPGTALAPLWFVIVPVGMLWLFAAGVVLVRRKE
jgi:hypothetical protein